MIYRCVDKRFIIGIGSCSYSDKKFHDLLSPSWGTRKACGVIQSKSEGLWWCRGPIRWWCNFRSESEGLKGPGAPLCKDRRRWMTQLKQREKICPSSIFYFIQSLSELDMLSHAGVGHLLQPAHQVKCWPLSETSSQTHTEAVLPAIWASLSSQVNTKLTITLYQGETFFS